MASKNHRKPYIVFYEPAWLGFVFILIDIHYLLVKKIQHSYLKVRLWKISNKVFDDNGTTSSFDDFGNSFESLSVVTLLK